MSIEALRADARAIWDAAVAAVDPVQCVRAAIASSQLAAIGAVRRIIVVGGGKAAAAMAAGLEGALENRLADVAGIVNVPAGAEWPLKAVKLRVARPAGSNEPAPAGVDGVRQMLALV